MEKITNVFKAFMYTIFEIIFVVVCVAVLKPEKADDVILFFEILIIFTLILCTILIINEIRKNRKSHDS